MSPGRREQSHSCLGHRLERIHCVCSLNMFSGYMILYYLIWAGLGSATPNSRNDRECRARTGNPARPSLLPLDNEWSQAWLQMYSNPFITQKRNQRILFMPIINVNKTFDFRGPGGFQAGFLVLLSIAPAAGGNPYPNWAADNGLPGAGLQQGSGACSKGSFNRSLSGPPIHGG